jgi:hypothetical protein
MPYRIILSLWDAVKDTDSFRAFTIIMLTAIVGMLVFTFNTLSAQTAEIERKVNDKLEHTVPRAEWLQMEKRLESIHADIREIRNNQRN